MAKKNDYILVNDVNAHVKRRAEILEKYPQVRKLYGTNPYSALYILLIVSLQFSLATIISTQAWWAILLLSYTVGAIANHSLYVMIHECCHNTVFKKAFYNKIMGIICDLPLFLPSAMGFRKYHMIHHKHLGEYSYDPDITSRTEANLIKNNPVTKALWLALFSLSQALRPLKVKYYKPLDRWSVINTVVIVIVNILIYKFMGSGALTYLALSTLFALGLHPLGGRWIQEHYITKEGQETYSYYGILNKLTFNMGFHNEHHDFMHIPWSRLPELKRTAPEYYDSLKYYKSWTKVLLNFIFNPEMTSYKRIIHPDRHPKSAIE
ncbi:fatty acid desaturase [Halobacteriovorax sp. JY17]|uniref:fatty acid desaturase n=1 Tax=Halobacteriovorax sp. JY17 TaxID=2014617 RepID=UPI000C3B1AAD|nr:fatty acid desaturase [Halobacteriovorax sp. JY17]PIK13663.1 MAG: fatty acid desaturase [Halobacteriovorax sp. JY17]